MQINTIITIKVVLSLLNEIFFEIKCRLDFFSSIKPIFDKKVLKKYV